MCIEQKGLELTFEFNQAPCTCFIAGSLNRTAPSRVSARHACLFLIVLLTFFRLYLLYLLCGRFLGGALLGSLQPWRRPTEARENHSFQQLCCRPSMLLSRRCSNFSLGKSPPTAAFAFRSRVHASSLIRQGNRLTSSYHICLSSLQLPRLMCTHTPSQPSVR